MQNSMSAAIAGAAALLALPASAHVVLSPAEAMAGGYYAGALRVSHGCAGSPTIALTVTLPPGIVTAKPQPKSGWRLEISREPLASPVKGEGGQLIRERVKSITWRGRLPDDEFDEFGLMAKLPQGGARLYFPTVQTCETGENRWVEVPADGQPRPRQPAPALDLAPAAAMPDMDMSHHH